MAGCTGPASGLHLDHEYVWEDACPRCCASRPSRWPSCWHDRLNGYLFIHVPRVFPAAGQRTHDGSITGDQDTSFQAMDRIVRQMVDIVDKDPGVDTVNGFTGGGGGPGGGTANQARMFVSLKPLQERKVTADQIIARLRPKLARMPGATLYMQASQDLRVGGRSSAALYQYTMLRRQSAGPATYGAAHAAELKTIPIIADVNSDQQNRGLQSMVVYDRATAARFGISSQLMDNTLYDAFGQRQVSTMYTSLNQYHVVMEAAPEYWQNPLSLRDIYVQSPGGTEVPLSAIASYAPTTAPLAVNASGPRPGDHHLVQPAAGRRAGRCRGTPLPRRRPSRPAAHHPDRFRRNRAGLPGFAGQRARS
jgi:multidrug efflux pump